MGRYYQETNSEEPRNNMAVDFWNVAAFIADVVAFMFTGIASEPYYVWRYMPLIGLAFAAVLIARYISIGSVLVPVQVHRTNSEILANVTCLAGIRGAVSAALALSLPEFPLKNTIVAITFRVVLFSLVQT